MFDKLKSRKLWATVLGAALVTFGSAIGIPDSVSAKIIPLVIAYVGGQSVVDAATAIKK